VGKWHANARPQNESPALFVPAFQVYYKDAVISYAEVIQGGIKGLIPPAKKLPKFDLTTDAQYAANLVNVNVWS